MKVVTTVVSISCSNITYQINFTNGLTLSFRDSTLECVFFVKSERLCLEK